MMSLTFGLFTQVRGSGPLCPLVLSGNSCFRPLLVNTQIKEKKGKEKRTYLVNMFQTRTMAQAMIPQMMMMTRMT